MKKLISVFALAFALASSAFSTHAHADSASPPADAAVVSPVDAATSPTVSPPASATDAGVVIITAPGSGVAVTPSTTGQSVDVIDPVDNPSGFYGQVKDAWAHGWALGLMIAAVGLLEGAVRLGETNASLAALGKGRTTIIIGGALAVLTATVAAFSKSASWSAAIIAAVGALLAYWHQAGTDPAKS